MYGLLTPREPVNEKLGWLDNPKNMGLLHAALGILANNSGHYGALAPALGTGGLLGLQAAMGTQQQNVQNRRNNRIDARRDYFSREEMDLRKKEFGIKEAALGLENRAGGMVGNIIGGFDDNSAPLPTAQAPATYGQRASTPELPTTNVEAPPPWAAVDAQILQMDDLVRQDPSIAQSKVYQETYNRLLKNREFLSKQGEVKSLGDGFFYQEGMTKPYVWDDKGNKRYVSSKEIQESGLKRAESGASKVTQTASLKGGESVLKEIGPMIKESRDEATSAVEQVDAAQRITAALDAGKVIAGPTATLRMKGAQIASMLGIGGKDTAEMIANTRQAIRGLAEFTISVRKKLKGQGQVTEYEQKTLQKAYSGEIEDMTVEELRVVASLTERLGRMMHKSHQTQLENMRKSEDPNIRGAVPFFSVPDLPAENTKIKRYNPATGKIE